MNFDVWPDRPPPHPRRFWEELVHNSRQRDGAEDGMRSKTIKKNGSELGASLTQGDKKSRRGDTAAISGHTQFNRVGQVCVTLRTHGAAVCSRRLTSNHSSSDAPITFREVRIRKAARLSGLNEGR